VQLLRLSERDRQPTIQQTDMHTYNIKGKTVKAQTARKAAEAFAAKSAQQQGYHVLAVQSFARGECFEQFAITNGVRGERYSYLLWVAHE